MKIRTWETIRNIHVMPEDTLIMKYAGSVVLKETIGREMTFNEAVVFDVEPGDFGDNVVDGIGGAFLSVE